MPSITQDHLTQYENDGFVIVEGFLDVDEDIQLVIDEYTQVLDQLAKQLYSEQKISNLYAHLPFGERLTKVYADSGEVHSQYFDFSLPQNGVIQIPLFGQVRPYFICCDIRNFWMLLQILWVMKFIPILSNIFASNPQNMLCHRRETIG